MKNIRIMSYAQLEAHSREEFVQDFVAVIVHSNDCDVPFIHDNYHMLDLIFEQFDDVDDFDGGMSYVQAEEIASFVFAHEFEDVDFVVSCRYGQSRSAGIAAAVSAYLHQDELAIFENPNKMPNMHCYALVCKALGIERTEEELRRLFLINAQATT